MPRLKHTLGGSLRPADPRRFLVEAMIGAMNADGHVDPREMQVLHGHLAQHDLFSRLPRDAANLLIDMAGDAMRHSEDGRVRAIARGLPTRTHRLAAYAMACEICAADGYFHETELLYLKALRRRLRLTERAASALFQGAQQYQAMRVLDQQLEHVAALMPMVVDCFALQHCRERRVLERHKRRLTEFLASLLDMHATEEEIREQVERALDPLEHSQNVEYGLKRLLRQVPEAADRYWLAVYIAAGYRYRGVERWQELPFVKEMCATFAIPKLDGVVAHARNLTEPRKKKHRDPRAQGVSF